MKLNLILFSSFVFVITACSVLLNNMTPIIRTEDPLNEQILNTYYTIEVSDSENHYSFYCEEFPDTLTLLVINSQKSDVFFNGSLIKNPGYSFRRPLIIDLTKENYDEENHKIHFTVETSGNPKKIRLYLGNLEQMQHAINSFDFLTTMSVGVLIAMLINGCSLALFKHSEKYISYYCLYIFILFIWTLSGSSISALEPIQSFLTKLNSYMYGLLMITGSLVCFKISDISLSKFKSENPLLIVLFFIILQIPFQFLSNSLSDILKFSFSLPGIIALTLYANRKNRMSYLLLFSYAVTMGLRLLPQLADKGLFTENLIMSSLRASHIFDMPFAFFCLITINYRFAQAFKKSENQAVLLEEMNQELDKKVEARTQELVLAEATRHNMMTNVFHDLRSPLFVLNGCLDMMKEDQGNQETIGIMKERLGYITQLVVDLFLIAKLEDKKVLFNYDQINLTQIVRDTLASFKVLAYEKEIIFQSDLEESVFCWGDPIRISQAISNLITNAIIYTQKGGKITVRLTADKKYSFLSVTDTGKGIKEEDLDKIFTKYYIVQDNGNKKSSGLGLSIAQEIIKQHQGQITVISKLDHGSTFTIQLPILEKGD